MIINKNHDYKYSCLLADKSKIKLILLIKDIFRSLDIVLYEPTSGAVMKALYHIPCRGKAGGDN